MIVLCSAQEQWLLISINIIKSHNLTFASTATNFLFLLFFFFCYFSILDALSSFSCINLFLSTLVFFLVESYVSSCFFLSYSSSFTFFCFSFSCTATLYEHDQGCQSCDKLRQGLTFSSSDGLSHIISFTLFDIIGQLCCSFWSFIILAL